MSRLSPAAVASLVRMLRQQHKGTICLVEGGDDKSFYRRYFDNHECKLVVGFGWESIVGAINLLEADYFPGVLGVIDADYLLVENQLPTSPNILITDCRDLEMGLIASNALEKVAADLCDADLLKTFCGGRAGLRDKLFAAVEFLSHLRWLNFRLKLGLKFKSLKFGEFTDRLSVTLDAPALIRAVKNDSQRHDLDEAHLVEQVEALRQRKASPLLVCSGHDVTAVFSLALRKTLSGAQELRDITPALIEARLRVAYDDAEWLRLRLVQRIREWEARNPPFRVLL